MMVRAAEFKGRELAVREKRPNEANSSRTLVTDALRLKSRNREIGLTERTHL